EVRMVVYLVKTADDGIGRRLRECSSTVVRGAMNPNQRQAELLAAEAQCRKLTMAALPTESELFERTLDVMFAGFQIASTMKVKTRWQQMILTLASRAYDNLQLAHQALLMGYPIQSGMLGRAALEDFQTGVYINGNHAKARYWYAKKYSRQKTAHKVPTFSELRKYFGASLAKKFGELY